MTKLKWTELWLPPRDHPCWPHFRLFSRRRKLCVTKVICFDTEWKRQRQQNPIDENILNGGRVSAKRFELQTDPQSPGRPAGSQKRSEYIS